MYLRLGPGVLENSQPRVDLLGSLLFLIIVFFPKNEVSRPKALVM
jgi:hypothetical protein